MGMFRNKKTNIVLLIVLAFSAVLFFQLLNGVLTSIRGGDGVNYVLLAKSIATGHGFADINLPGAPPHTQYPPLLPLVLSPVIYLFGFNIVWMQLIIIIFGLATVWMVKVYFEEDAGEGVALALALLTATNFYFLFFVKEIMTEVPYAFLSLLALHYFRKYEKGAFRGGLLIAVCALAAAAYMMRMIGVTLCAAMAAVLFSGCFSGAGGGRDKWRKLIAFVALAALPFILWTIRNSLYSEGVATYQSIFMRADYYSEDSGGLAVVSFFGRFAKNSGYYYEAVTRTILSSSAMKGAFQGLLLRAVLFVFFVIFLAGFVYESWFKRGVKEVYILFYFGLLTVWPVYGSGDARRYIVPVLPFIYYYFLTGVRLLARFKEALSGHERLKLRRAVLAVSIFLLAVNLFDIRRLLTPEAAKRSVAAAASLPRHLAEKSPALPVEALGSFYRTAPCWDNYMLASLKLREAAGPDDVVLARKPEIVSLITGGYAARFPYTRDGAAMLRFMEDMKISYVLIDGCYREAGEYVVPVILANGERFTVLLNERDGTAILRVNRD
ncbi:MAG: glycosyltransferase family 39 protein [Deltaproteobacteria bacterium]|nr:glycosyltransferase family 39 protein [Deltaproteobacteria bacterium]